ncbi:hypothetical protein Aduo_008507 [Ancylostoma duodenale]
MLCFQVVAAQHFVIFVAFCVGVKLLKCALAVTFALITVFCIAVIVLHPVGEIKPLHMLYHFSNPASLFEGCTYLIAMRKALSSFGLCVFGLFCASSFRRKEGRSYQITRIVFWSNMFVSLLSTIAVLMILSYNQEAGHGLFTSMRTNMPGLRFALAAVPEHFFRHDSIMMYTIPYYCGLLLMNVSSSFDVVFVIKALFRDFLPDYNFLFGLLSMVLFCCISAAYYIFVTLNFANGEIALETYAVNFTKYFFICLNVIIFVHVYGIHDFEVDVVSILGEKQEWLSFLNPTWSIGAYTYSIIAVMVLQAVECNRMLGWLQFRWLYDEDYILEETEGLDEHQFILISFIGVLLYVVPFFKILWDIGTLDKLERILELFTISHKHPSYLRRAVVYGEGTATDVDQIWVNSPTSPGTGSINAPAVTGKDSPSIKIMSDSKQQTSSDTVPSPNTPSFTPRAPTPSTPRTAKTPVDSIPKVTSTTTVSSTPVAGTPATPNLSITPQQTPARTPRSNI